MNGRKASIPSTKCIVCGRNVPKSGAVDYHVNSPSTGTANHWGAQVQSEVDLKSIDDCRRHTNMPYIISAARNKDGFIRRFTAWDGERYQNGGWFCTNRCAIKQGMAAAQLGHRFTWRS